MTHYVRLLVLALSLLWSTGSAQAFTFTSEEVFDRSAAYANLPFWQAIRTDPNDSISAACAAFKRAGGNASWRDCVKAVVAENRAKFPDQFNQEKDFWLHPRVVYLLPVVPGQMDFAALPPDLAAEQKEFIDAVLKVIEEFNARIDTLESGSLSGTQVSDMIDQALAAAAAAPTSSLSGELDRQAARLGVLEDAGADQSRINKDFTDRFEAIGGRLVSKADRASHDALSAKVDTKADQASLDALSVTVDAKTDQAAHDALADQVSLLKGQVDALPVPLGAGEIQTIVGEELDKRPTLTTDDVKTLINDQVAGALAPSGSIGQALAGKADRSPPVSIWRIDKRSPVEIAVVGILALLLLALSVWFIIHRRQVGRRLTAAETQAKTVDGILAQQADSVSGLYKQIADVGEKVKDLEEVLGFVLERDIEGRFKAPKGVEEAINDMPLGKEISLTITGVGPATAHPKVEVVKDLDSEGNLILRCLGIREGQNVIHPHMKGGKPYFTVTQLYKLLAKAEKSGHVVGLRSMKVA